MSRISVVVISRNEGSELARTVENYDATLPASSEILVIDDSSTDGSAALTKPKRGRIRVARVNNFGVARARNHGARLAKGDIIVYSDAHLRLEPDWWRPMVDALEDKRVGGVAPAITGYRPSKIAYGLTFRDASLEVRWLRRKPRTAAPAPIIPGCCFATRRDVIEATGGWDDGQIQRGNIDNEGSVRLWTLGYHLLITPDTVVRHKFRKRSPYQVRWGEFLFNRLRLAFVHFSAERLGRVVARLRDYPGYGEALERIAESDTSSRRKFIHSQRIWDDNWYAERFNMTW